MMLIGVQQHIGLPLNENDQELREQLEEAAAQDGFTGDVGVIIRALRGKRRECRDMIRSYGP